MDMLEIPNVDLGERVYLPKGRVGRVTAINMATGDLDVVVEPRRPKVVRFSAADVARQPEEMRVGFASVAVGAALAKAIVDGESWAMEEAVYQLRMACEAMREGLSPAMRAKWDAGEL